jgi:tetratricopeptide (TPR) repeat protein
MYQGREEEGAAAIAHHLVHGGADASQIAHFGEMAGDRAYALSAYPEAVQYYTLAVEHRGMLPTNARAEEHLHLAHVLERLGECTRVQGNYTEARNYFEQALEVHNQYRLSAPDLDPHYEAQVEALLWCEIGRTWYDTGDNAQAQHCYSRGEQVLREAKIAGGPAWANLFLQQSFVLWQEGCFEEARQTAQHALTIFENSLGEQNRTAANAFHSTATRRTLAGDPVDLGRTHRLLAILAGTVGQSTIALDHLQTALAIFELYDRQQEIASICGDMGDVYLRKGEYILAQAILRRSLNIAEQIGDAVITAVAFANLGVLSARVGDLPEAETFLKRGITLVEQVNDPVYVSLWQSCQAHILQDQGKMIEAKLSLRGALTISRAMNFTLCIGVALVVLGQLRIAQALQVEENSSGSSRTLERLAASSYTHVLRKARISLQRALSLEGLEAETRTEGQLALARVAFLMGEVDGARQQALQLMEQAQQYEQTWLLACAQRLMGSILAALGQHEQAHTCFEQAPLTLAQSGMRLECARAFQSYGVALLEQCSPGDSGYVQGLKYLQDARQTFRECNAHLDLQMVARLLARYKPHGVKAAKR